MRKGLLKTVQFPDELANRFQANVNDALEQLATDHDVVSAPVLAMAATGAIGAGKSVVVYSGNPGAVLTLPLASAQGNNTGAVVLLANASGGSITLRAAGNDTISGAKSVSLASLALLVLASDGVSKWFAPPAGVTEARVKIVASYHP